MSVDPVRTRLLDLIAERGTDFATVSRAIDRNHSYLHTFVRKGIPLRLAEREREKLGTYFGVSPDEFRDGKAREQIAGQTTLDPKKLRIALIASEEEVRDIDVPYRAWVVAWLMSLAYDVLIEEERDGRPIDDERALFALRSLLRVARRRAGDQQITVGGVESGKM